MKIGIIGCGVISHTYVKHMRKFHADRIEIAGAGDVDVARAEAFAQQYDIPFGGTVEKVLDDPEIGLVVDLTPPKFHTDINRRILNAGKHLFCEKPFALTMEDAGETVRLAKEKGLLIGTAPDTFLSASQATCRKLISDGWIGKPLYATANMMSSGVETWHPVPEPFYSAGGGPIYDMGGYYLSAIVTMLGEIDTICSMSGKGFEKRHIYTGPRAGSDLEVKVPTHYTAILRLRTGVIVSMNISFDIWKSSLPMLEIYGTEGTLQVPDPNMTDGCPKVFRKEQILSNLEKTEEEKQQLQQFRELPELFVNHGHYVRGAGVAELIDAIEGGKPHRANEKLALHVTEAMTGILRSAEDGQVYQMETRLS